jgi:hypothetical protein
MSLLIVRISLIQSSGLKLLLTLPVQDYVRKATFSSVTLIFLTFNVGLGILRSYVTFYWTSSLLALSMAYLADNSQELLQVNGRRYGLWLYEWVYCAFFSVFLVKERVYWSPGGRCKSFWLCRSWNWARKWLSRPKVVVVSLRYTTHQAWCKTCEICLSDWRGRQYTRYFSRTWLGTC